MEASITWKQLLMFGAGFLIPIIAWVLRIETAIAEHSIMIRNNTENHLEIKIDVKSISDKQILMDKKNDRVLIILEK